MFSFLKDSSTSSPTKSSALSALPSADYFLAKASVVESIRGNKEGRIKLYGIFWFAKLSDPAINPIEPGCTVTVVDRERNTLIVIPDALA